MTSRIFVSTSVLISYWPREFLEMLLLILLVLLADVARSERMSGLYVDNGFDQTVVRRLMSWRQKREVEHEIINLLNLPEPPPKHRDDSLTSSQAKHSAPKFLLDIYKNTLESRSYGYGDSDADFNQNMRTIHQSDAIMTFAAQSFQMADEKYKLGKRLWFNISKVPASDLILGAELRVYRSLETVKTTKNHGPFTLEAYRVLRLEDGERELKYIDSVNVSSSHEGWVVLNVSEALRYWLQDPLGDQGLYLSVHPLDGHVHEMKPKDIGFDQLNDGAERQSFMAAFFKSSGLRQHNVRHKREIKYNLRSDNINLDFRSNPYIHPQIPRWPQRTCQMRTLYVSFKDLKWQNWIIAPDGYNAYYCSGECKFPLNAHMNSTNHAILQSFVHLRFPGKVPKPCCAPTKLSSLSVIYYVDENNVILKKYNDMVVKNCGCQ